MLENHRYKDVSGDFFITIDGHKVEVAAGTTILEAARKAHIYIPTLCYHPDLPPAKGSPAVSTIYQGDRKIENAAPAEAGQGCGLCVVEVEGSGDLVDSCATAAEEGMVVVTSSERITARRQEKLVPVLARHRHACLTCAQQEGCSRTQCSANVPENERCCPQFGHCELQNVARYVGILPATPKWVPTDFAAIKSHPLFERDYSLCIGCTRCVRACRDLRGIEAIGFVVDAAGQVQVGTLADSLEVSGCKFCTACVEVCPTGALTDRGVSPGTREEDLVPCRAACPAHIDVPGYVRMIAQCRRDEAHAIIREKVPFPGVLGRVCIHPCEAACRRGQVNQPISICALKRYAADGAKGRWKLAGRCEPDTGKPVAVVGAGPAGLTAAFYLRKKGHAVTVFEARSQAGGMLRYGIPEYRLPRPMLDDELQSIWDAGVEFKPNQTLGEDFTLESLKQNGFEAVFIGVGAPLSRRIPLEGCNLPDVLWGLDFLCRVACGAKVRLRDHVVVIGGGNLAVDAALTALRCGAHEVSMVCLEPESEMPAGACEIEGALAEGVKIMPSWGPDRIISENGRISALDLVECTDVFDESGNFCPQFGERKECIQVDQIILAVGQAADLAFLGTGGAIEVNRGLIVVNAESLETKMKGVYAGGDVTLMPGTIIHAIAAGWQAAASIDRALGGNGEIEEVFFPRAAPEPKLGRHERFALWARERVSERDAATRKLGFDEIALGFTHEQALKEARRCLQCDLRLGMRCNPPPPLSALAYDAEHLQQVPDTEGVFQLLDADHKIVAIKGTATLRQELIAALGSDPKAVWFEFEEDKMYSKRESELLQKYLQQHGEMPSGGGRAE
jgi:NADPH-dependent glutamate synthase beta subunit-like oxidoreductase